MDQNTKPANLLDELYIIKKNKMHLYRIQNVTDKSNSNRRQDY